MAARALEFDESNPDVLVAYHAAVNQQITGATIDHWGDGRGRYGGGWGTSTASVNSYNEGTMVIDVIDAQQNELVWRGVTNGAVDKPERAQEKIPETVAKLMADFPLPTEQQHNRTLSQHMKTRKILTTFLLTLVILFWSDSSVSAQEAKTGTLVINIAGIESDDGRMMIAVHDGKENWMKTSVYEKALKIEQGVCTWTIDAVPYGDYGIAVFHDENGNNKHDKNLVGIPKEPYGFSNNARGRFGPPGWAKAHFTLADSTFGVEIEVK